MKSKRNSNYIRYEDKKADQILINNSLRLSRDWLTNPYCSEKGLLLDPYRSARAALRRLLPFLPSTFIYFLCACDGCFDWVKGLMYKG